MAFLNKWQYTYSAVVHKIECPSQSTHQITFILCKLYYPHKTDKQIDKVKTSPSKQRTRKQPSE